MDPVFEASPELQEILKKRALNINERLGKEIITTDFLAKDNMTGRDYGDLHIIKYIGRTARKDNIYLCHCKNCENDVMIRANNIRNLNQQTCGCIKYSMAYINDQLYSVLIQINRRCYDPADANYKRCGAKGVTLCDEWNKQIVGTRQAYANFYVWAIDNGYKSGLSIDRRDNNKGYFPDNCWWTDHKHQNVNTSRNVYYQYGKYYFPRTFWSKISGIPKTTLKYRLDNNWSVENALLTPPGCLPSNDKNHIIVPKEMLEFNKYEEGLLNGQCYYVKVNPEYISEEI